MCLLHHYSDPSHGRTRNVLTMGSRLGSRVASLSFTQYKSDPPTGTSSSFPSRDPGCCWQLADSVAAEDRQGAIRRHGVIGVIRSSGRDPSICHDGSKKSKMVARMPAASLICLDQGQSLPRPDWMHPRRSSPPVIFPARSMVALPL